ncbi:MAG: hypothetical protein AAF439_00665 [Pseudomonadota bacterium]
MKLEAFIWTPMFCLTVTAICLAGIAYRLGYRSILPGLSLLAAALPILALALFFVDPPYRLAANVFGLTILVSPIIVCGVAFSLALGRHDRFGQLTDLQNITRTDVTANNARSASRTKA